MSKRPRTRRPTPQEQALLEEMVDEFVTYELEGQLPRSEIAKRMRAELEARFAALHGKRTPLQQEVSAMLARVVENNRRRRSPS